MDTNCYGLSGLAYFITKMDSNFMASNRKLYRLNGSCAIQPTNLSSTKDNGALSVGYGQIRCGNFICLDKFYALRIDSNLQPIWGKYYTSHVGGAQFGKQISDGGFLIGLNLDTAGAVVNKIDSMGNTIWCKSYLRPKGFIHDCLINDDGTAIISGFTDSINVPPAQYPPNFSPKLFITKIDSNGDILWSKAFESDWHWLMSPTKIVSTADNGIAILGTVGTNNSYSPILIKTNANGDTAWTAIHGQSSVYYQATSLLHTSDRGFLIGGEAPWAGIPAWLYKTDSLGQVPCNMLHEPIYTYPIFPSDSNIILSSVDGVISLPIILNDTTYAPRIVWDDCDYSKVPWQIIARPKLNIYPNPTAGIVTMEVENPLKSDCWYSIYDQTGRLIIQRFLYTEKERIEEDLSPFGKGLYFLEFTEKDQMSVRKVVVE